MAMNVTKVLIGPPRSRELTVCSALLKRGKPKKKGLHIHELYEEADETHYEEASTSCHCDLGEFVLVGLCTSPHKHF